MNTEKTNVINLDKKRAPIVAYAYENGIVGFGDSVARGSLPIVAGPEHYVRNVLDANAYRNHTGNPLTDYLTVPGIEPATAPPDRLKAFISFVARLKMRYKTNTTLQFGDQIDVAWDDDQGGQPA